MAIRSVVNVLLLSFFVSIFAKDLPSYVPICKRHDPKLSECIKNATLTLRPYLTKGIPELNIPAVDPLRVPMVKLEQGTSVVNYKLKLTDIKIYGLGNYRFQNLQLDASDKELKLRGNVEVPDLYLEADYVIDGRALLVPIKGNGLFTANLTDTKAVVDMAGSVVKRKSNEYLRVMDTKVDLSIGKAKAHFSNLFDGDSTLSSVTNSFLNENTKDIIEEVKPAIEAVAAMVVDDIANNFVRTSPYNKLLPK